MDTRKVIIPEILSMWSKIFLAVYLSKWQNFFVEIQKLCLKLSSSLKSTKEEKAKKIVFGLECEIRKSKIITKTERKAPGQYNISIIIIYEYY